MKTYIIVEELRDAAILGAILPPSVLPLAQIIVGGSTSSSVSLARSLVSDRNESLLLIMNSETINKEAIAEQEHEIRELLGAVAIHTCYDIIFAVPELEVIFFHDLDILAQALQISIDHDSAINSIYEPRKVLTNLLEKSPYHDQAQWLASLDKDIRDQVAQHSIIQKIIHVVTPIHMRKAA